MRVENKGYFRAAILILTGFVVSGVHAESRSEKIQQQLHQLETQSGGRLGVVLIDSADNTQIRYRANERFPMCSTSKVMAVAALLQQSEKNSAVLQQRLAINASDLVNYNPITEKQVGSSMTLAELSAAALQYSDNAAMNLILDHLGGPAKVTAFAKEMGDSDFRLDRKEPELNSAIPGDPRDTTTPLSMAHSLQKLTLGKALAAPQREQLVQWMKGNTTGRQSIAAGLPSGWKVGDKTGSCDYGGTNDIAVIWREKGAPLILTTFFVQPQPDAKSRRDVLAAAAKIVTAQY
ncbi:class A beta-lactamase [Pantoea sp. Acro-835]|uniref:Beta-lactamase n=1 Tax=Candidatus Pantoea multigeneris TaxID=2608357 RepID=A0ABX0RA56_9GAMM|nr:class A beta-lactamase [Pantoea multigeneris]